MIQNYDEFITELHRAGFSLGGGSSKGIYAAVPFDWTEQPAGTQVRWHTGEPDTDPWEWRMRVLEERSDIAYAKVFFRGSGYITREWYPFFMSVRRRGMTFEEMWESGRVTELSRRIYEAVRDNGRVAMHDIKRLAGLSGETSAHIEKAMTDLQMSMLLDDMRQAAEAQRVRGTLRLEQHGILHAGGILAHRRYRRYPAGGSGREDTRKGA